MVEVTEAALEDAREFAAALRVLATKTPGLDKPVDGEGGTGLTLAEEYAHAADPNDFKWNDLQGYLAQMPPEAVAREVLNQVLASITRYQEVSEAEAITGAKKLVTFSDADFGSLVLGSDIPVVVDYWAPWCAPCIAIAPILEVLASEFDGQITFGKVNVDENEGAARHGLETLKIQGIPCLVLYSNGAIVDHMVGIGRLTAIRDFVSKGAALPA